MESVLYFVPFKMTNGWTNCGYQNAKKKLRFFSRNIHHDSFEADIKANSTFIKKRLLHSRICSWPFWPRPAARVELVRDMRRVEGRPQKSHTEGMTTNLLLEQSCLGPIARTSQGGRQAEHSVRASRFQIGLHLLQSLQQADKHRE